MGYWMMGDFGWGWFMPVVMIAFWGLVLWGIVMLVRYLTKNNDPGQANSAIQLLKVRYAKGEISQAEYDEKKKGLI